MLTPGKCAQCVECWQEVGCVWDTDYVIATSSIPLFPSSFLVSSILLEFGFLGLYMLILRTGENVWCISFKPAYCDYIIILVSASEFGQACLRSAALPECCTMASLLNTAFANCWTVTAPLPPSPHHTHSHTHFHLHPYTVTRCWAPCCPLCPATPPLPSTPLTLSFRQHCLHEQWSHCYLKVAYCEWCSRGAAEVTLTL